jgi:hypothetical protein
LDVLSASMITLNCRSDAIQMGMKLLKDQGKAEQVFNNPPIVRLLPSVIDAIKHRIIQVE